MIFHDMQDPVSGMLADSMSTIKRSWLCTKDPVHGWALGHLMRIMPQAVTKRRLQEAYGPLSLWTNYWVKCRNLGGDGLPCIIHPDESFDNTTSNTIDGAAKAPEIATYLALQMDALSDVASKLGYAADARRWREQSDALVNTLVRVLWDPRREQFVSKRVRDGYVGPGDCVLPFIPLLLGKRLPAAIQQALANGLLRPGRFLTPFGFATEALTSPLYSPDSYVKGPTWPPINLFLAEALAGAGQTAAAAKVHGGFLHSCLRHGMSEHFDAKTGDPGGDPGYIWTAALFLGLGAKQGIGLNRAA